MSFFVSRPSRLFMELNRYISIPRIMSILNGIQLINYDEIVGKGIVISPEALYHLCDYPDEITESIEGLRNNENMDMIFAITPDNIIVGFIICQLNAPTLLNSSNIYSIKLICVNEEIKSIILIGAYIFCIQYSGYLKIGLLELGSNYSNTSAFMTYTRFGFRKDISFRIPLSNYASLHDALIQFPMSVYIEYKYPTEYSIIGIVDQYVGGASRSLIEEDSRIYNSSLINRGHRGIYQPQLISLISLNNLLVKIEIIHQDILRIMSSYFSIIYDPIKKLSLYYTQFGEHFPEEYTILFKLFSTLDMSQQFIDKLIYLETTVKAQIEYRYHEIRSTSSGGGKKNKRKKTKKNKISKTRKHKTKYIRS